MSKSGKHRSKQIQLTLPETKELRAISAFHVRNKEDCEPSDTKTIKGLIVLEYNHVSKLEFLDDGYEKIESLLKSFYDFQKKRKEYIAMNPLSKSKYHLVGIYLNTEVYEYCEYLKKFYAKAQQSLRTEDIVSYLIYKDYCFKMHKIKRWKIREYKALREEIRRHKTEVNLNNDNEESVNVKNVYEDGINFIYEEEVM